MLFNSEPIWEEFATSLKGSDINVAKVDGSVERDLTRRFSIRGYPTIKLHVPPHSCSNNAEVDGLLIVVIFYLWRAVSKTEQCTITEITELWKSLPISPREAIPLPPLPPSLPLHLQQQLSRLQPPPLNSKPPLVRMAP